MATSVVQVSQPQGNDAGSMGTGHRGSLLQRIPVTTIVLVDVPNEEVLRFITLRVGHSTTRIIGIRYESRIIVVVSGRDGALSRGDDGRIVLAVVVGAPTGEVGDFAYLLNLAGKC